MIKHWIRRWLGLDEIENGVNGLISSHWGIDNKLNLIKQNTDNLQAFTPGLGRVLAKLDPQYGIHEDDKQDASKALGEDIINRLKAEDKARRHQEGKL